MVSARRRPGPFHQCWSQGLDATRSRTNAEEVRARGTTSSRTITHERRRRGRRGGEEERTTFANDGDEKNRRPLWPVITLKPTACRRPARRPSCKAARRRVLTTLRILRVIVTRSPPILFLLPSTLEPRPPLAGASGAHPRAHDAAGEANLARHAAAKGRTANGRRASSRPRRRCPKHHPSEGASRKASSASYYHTMRTNRAPQPNGTSLPSSSSPPPSPVRLSKTTLSKAALDHTRGSLPLRE